MSSTFRRSLAVLTFALFGASMAFLAGARLGAALDGRCAGITLAHIPTPQLRAVK